MNWLITSARRAMWLVVLGAAGGTAIAWWRQRQAGSDPINPPEWPPLGDTAATGTSSTSSVAPPAEDADQTSTGAPDTVDHTNATQSIDVSALVNALVDTPDARSTSADGSWAPPNDDGSCPDGFTIKANDNSGIYHVPTGRFYARTKAERCYATAEGAEADGYRAAKS